MEAHLARLLASGHVLDSLLLDGGLLVRHLLPDLGEPGLLLLLQRGHTLRGRVEILLLLRDLRVRLRIQLSLALHPLLTLLRPGTSRPTRRGLGAWEASGCGASGVALWWVPRVHLRQVLLVLARLHLGNLASLLVIGIPSLSALLHHCLLYTSPSPRDS